MRHTLPHVPVHVCCPTVPRAGRAPAWLGAVLALASVAGVARAQPIYVDQNAPPGGTGAGWATALQTLQQGLTLARSSGRLEIRIADGTYLPTQGLAPQPDPRAVTFTLDRTGLQLLGGYAGDGAPDPDDRDSDLYPTILSGDLAGNDLPNFVNNGENSRHVLQGFNPATLDGLTIAAGKADGGLNDARGSGLQVFFNSSATCNNVRFEDHDSSGQGGAVFLFRSTTVFTDCVFLNNRCGDSGGGIFYFDAIGSKRVERCTFLSNRCGGGGGGGLGGDTTGLTCVNSVFVGNRAGATLARGVGGGIGVGGNATIANCTFVANQLTVGGAQSGGGLAVTASSAVATIRNCIFWANADSSDQNEDAQIGTVFGGTPTPIVQSTLVQGLSAFAGSGNIDGDPSFVDADGADNTVGTDDDDVRLQPVSIAIDAGDNVLIPAGVTTDRDGNPRIVCDVVDMGAYESGEGGSAITITCPADIEVECGLSDPNSTGVATAVDACSPDVPEVDFMDSVEAMACGAAGDPIEVITRRWFVVGEEDIFCDQIITVVDTIAPTITCPADVDVQLDDHVCTATGVELGTPTGEDCTEITFSNDAPAEFLPGETVVTWTATDACGNAATCEQTVTVTLGQTAAITCPADTQLECGDTDPNSAGSATAADVCTLAAFGVTYIDTIETLECSQPGDPIETITRRWSVVDHPDVFCDQVITVVDTTAPSIECPPAIYVEVEEGQCAATLNLGSPVVADCTYTTVTNDAPAMFLPGETIVTWTATDACGLTSTCEQAITVADLQEPFLQCSVAENMLWPANKQLIDVGLSIVVDDNCDSGLPPVITVYSNEDDVTGGGGQVSPDAAGALELRAERESFGLGRVYLIVVSAEDLGGNIGTSTCVVVVPHDRGKLSLKIVALEAVIAQVYFDLFGEPPPWFELVGDGPVLP